MTVDDDVFAARVIEAIDVLDEASQLPDRRIAAAQPSRPSPRVLAVAAAAVLVAVAGVWVAQSGPSGERTEVAATASTVAGGDEEVAVSTTSVPTNETSVSTSVIEATTTSVGDGAGDVPGVWVQRSGATGFERIDPVSGDVVAEMPVGETRGPVIWLEPVAGGGLVVVRAADGGGSVVLHDREGGVVRNGFGYNAAVSPDGSETAVASFAGLIVQRVDDESVESVDSTQAFGNNSIAWLDSDHLAWVVNDSDRDFVRVVRVFERVEGGWELERSADLGSAEIGSTTIALWQGVLAMSWCAAATVPDDCPRWEASVLDGTDLRPEPDAPWLGAQIVGEQDGRLLLLRPGGEASILDDRIETPLEGTFDAVGW